MAWFKYFKSNEVFDPNTVNENYSYPYCKRTISRFTPKDTLQANTWIFASISDININKYKNSSLEDVTDSTSYIVVYEKSEDFYPVETVIEGDYLYFKTYEEHIAGTEIVGEYSIYYNTPSLRKLNQVDNAGTDDYQINYAPVWEDIDLDLFIYDQIYSYSISAVGTVYSISSGSLPDGITINSSTGLISGTVAETGAYSFTVRATTDDGKYYNEASFSGTIQEIPSWVDNSLVNIDYNSSYSDSVWADGVPAPTYSISSGTLPDGITLNATTGALIGTSTDSGAYSFTIKAENIHGSVTQSFSGTVQTPPSWSDQTLGIITKASAYSDGVSATGTSPITYSVYSGSLPSSITLNTSTGAITGTTAASGSYSFTIRATNSWGYVEKAFSGTIYEAPSWTDSSIANMIYGQAYSDGVTASGYPAVTYSVFAGALPSGIVLNSSTGAITGTSSTAGSYSFTIKAENAAGSVTQMFTDDLFVTPSWTDNTLAAFTYNTAYSDGVSATGSPPYTISSGSLPTGLSLNPSSGAVTGTPTYYGTYSFQIKAENETGSVTQNFSGAIYRVPFWTDSTLTTPTYNVSYSNGVTADGYDAMYYTISSGSLPSGFSLNPTTGAVTGTYTSPINNSSFTYNFTIRATNSVGNVEQAFTWVIAIPFSASGGTVTTSGGYTVHTFTSSGNFTVNSGSKSVEYIVVGGGGGGGNNAAGTTGYIWSGGGGAGGLITGTTTLSAGYASSSNYALAVGAGGAVNAEGNYSTMNIISSPGYIYCVGGGRGGGWSSGAVSGGSGGGGCGTTSSSGAGASGTSAEGNSGGNGAVGGGGGGGGKGSTGSNGDGSTNVGGNGGTGQTFTWGSSLDGYLAGGGGGAGFNGGGSGGSSIGGSGARLDYNVTLVNATSGTVNKGSGGGGAASAYSYAFNVWRYANGGSGSSGCVIVRYLT
jgi:hypothetical protein